MDAPGRALCAGCGVTAAFAAELWPAGLRPPGATSFLRKCVAVLGRFCTRATWGSCAFCPFLCTPSRHGAPRGRPGSGVGTSFGFRRRKMRSSSPFFVVVVAVVVVRCRCRVPLLSLPKSDTLAAIRVPNEPLAPPMSPQQGSLRRPCSWRRTRHGKQSAAQGKGGDLPTVARRRNPRPCRYRRRRRRRRCCPPTRLSSPIARA